MSPAADPDEPRVINPLLLIGLYSAPLLFVWFLFGKDYARSTRRAVFIYALTTRRLSYCLPASSTG